jgi:hypothetical protein
MMMMMMECWNLGAGLGCGGIKGGTLGSITARGDFNEGHAVNGTMEGCD